IRMQTIDDEAALLLGLDDVLALENLQMVRDIRNVFLELGGDLAHILWSAAQNLNNPQAVFVGQGLEALGTFLGGDRVVLHRSISPNPFFFCSAPARKL